MPPDRLLEMVSIVLYTNNVALHPSSNPMRAANPMRAQHAQQRLSSRALGEMALWGHEISLAGSAWHYIK